MPAVPVLFLLFCLLPTPGGSQAWAQPYSEGIALYRLRALEQAGGGGRTALGGVLEEWAELRKAYTERTDAGFKEVGYAYDILEFWKVLPQTVKQRLLAHYWMPGKRRSNSTWIGWAWMKMPSALI